MLAAGPALGCAAPVTVVDGGPDDAAEACTAYRIAADFLAAQGYPLDGTQVTVRFADLVEVPGYGAVSGYFDDETGVHLHRNGRLTKEGLAASLLPLWQQAVAVQEIGHALLWAEFGTGMTRLAHEMAGSILMYATMPDDLRTALLERIDAHPQTDRRRFNLPLYAFDPERFGASAYLTWTVQPRLFEDLVTGRFVPDRLSEGREP